MDKSQAEAANMRIAATWADGLGLEYAGVSLADCVAYNVLSTLGRIALGEIEQAAQIFREQAAAVQANPGTTLDLAHAIGAIDDETYSQAKAIA